MAPLILTDASVVFNGSDLSNHVKEVSIDFGVETKDDTAMGMAAKSNKGAMKVQTVKVKLIQDFAAGNIDAVLFPLVGATGTLTIKPTSAAVSVTNPKYEMTALLSHYPPLGNSVGDLAMTEASFVGAGGVAMTRSIV